MKKTRTVRPYFIFPAMVIALIATLALPALASETIAPESVGDRKEEMSITDGRVVTFEYILKGDDGSVIDSSEGGEPFVYTHGRQEVVPGLESRLAGMQIGDTKVVTVNPEEGYGILNPQAIVEMPLDRVPPEARVVGRQLQGTGPDGQPMFPVVKEVKESVVVLDFNHPLAGQTLHFDVKIVSIEEKPAESSSDSAPAAAKSEE